MGEKINRSWILTLVASGFMAGWASPIRAAIYTFTPLGTPGTSGESVATAINNSGQVVGQLIDSNTAGYSTSSGFAPLGGGNSASSSASAVNAGGVAVGYGVLNSDATGGTSALYFTTGSNQSTANAIPAGSSTTSTVEANAINGTGTAFQAVGQYYVTDPSSSQTVSRSFLWNYSVARGGDASVTLLDTSNSTTGLGGTGIGASSTAQGINSAGIIVGQASNANSDLHGYVYNPATTKMYDLGSAIHAASGDFSNAVAINNSNTIIGQTQVAGGTDQGFAYSGFAFPTVAHPSFTAGTYTPLGSLDSDNPESQALAVNLAGVIVGTSSYEDEPDSRAFIYENGQMYDLNSLSTLPTGWVLDNAMGINDSGEIVGDATYTDRQGNPSLYAYELNLATSVPEPAGLGICLAGVWPLARRPRLKKRLR